MSQNPNGATLLFSLFVPGASTDIEADAIADQFRDIINEERERNGGQAGFVQVSIPLPVWVTPETLTRMLNLDSELTASKAQVEELQRKVREAQSAIRFYLDESPVRSCRHWKCACRVEAQGYQNNLATALAELEGAPTDAP